MTKTKSTKFVEEAKKNIKETQTCITTSFILDDNEGNETQFEIIEGYQHVNIIEVWHMLKNQSWWKDAVIERFLTAIMNSRCFSLVAIDGLEKKTVGFARVITDGATFAYIDDVVIHEKYRGLGLATILNTYMLEHPDLQTLRRWLLIACNKVEDLYVNIGFEKSFKKSEYMHIYNKEAYENDKVLLIKSKRS